MLIFPVLILYQIYMAAAIGYKACFHVQKDRKKEHNCCKKFHKDKRISFKKNQHNKLKILTYQHNIKKFNEIIFFVHITIKKHDTYNLSLFKITTSTIILKKITNDDQIDNTCHQSQVSHPQSLGDKYDPFGSSLMIFFCIVGLISLRSLLWYQWCYNQNFNVPLIFFSLPSLLFLAHFIFFYL